MQPIALTDTETPLEASNRDEVQMELDVARSFIPKTDTGGTAHRDELLRLLLSLFRRYPSMSYYQGYHDVAQVVLLTFDSNPATAESLLAAISLSLLRDHVLPTLSAVLTALTLVPIVLKKYEEVNKDVPPLAASVNQVGGHYALSSYLTLCAHGSNNVSSSQRIFDFVFSHGTITAMIYIIASLLITQRHLILADIDSENDEDILLVNMTRAVGSPTLDPNAYLPLALDLATHHSVTLDDVKTSRVSSMSPTCRNLDQSSSTIDQQTLDEGALLRVLERAVTEDKENEKNIVERQRKRRKTISRVNNAKKWPWWVFRSRISRRQMMMDVLGYGLAGVCMAIGVRMWYEKRHWL